MTVTRSNDEIRNSVRIAYAAVAETASGCCDPNSGPSHGAEMGAGAPIFCCPAPGESAPTDGHVLGYGEDELAPVFNGSNLGLGCAIRRPSPSWPRAKQYWSLAQALASIVFSQRARWARQAESLALT